MNKPTEYQIITDEIRERLELNTLYDIKDENGTEFNSSGHFIKCFKSICKEIKTQQIPHEPTNRIPNS